MSGDVPSVIRPLEKKTSGFSLPKQALWRPVQPQQRDEHTAMFIPMAAKVLNMAQGPEEEHHADDLTQSLTRWQAASKSSPGTRMPQNDRAAVTNPSKDRNQKTLANVVAIGADDEENSHDRAANQPSVSVPDLTKLNREQDRREEKAVAVMADRQPVR